MLDDLRRMILEAVSVKKHFPVSGGFGVGGVRGWIKAVDGVSVGVAEGETLGIVGESGSGKTTLAKLFLLLERPTGGALCFEGADMSGFRRGDLARYRRSVQAVFQDPYSSLNPRMRVQHIVAEPLPRDNGGVAKSERVGEALELVGLKRGSAGLYPHEFSGGQRQRIAIARALVTYPKLIILDEPVSALDASIRAQILNLLKDVQRASGVAVILVTHDFGIVAANADRVAVMYAGRIVEMGSTLEVFDKPAHPYTQALLRCLPDVDLKHERLVEIGGQPPDLATLGAGCPFAPRCPKRQPICDEAYPPSVNISDGHTAHCWIASAP